MVTLAAMKDPKPTRQVNVNGGGVRSAIHIGAYGAGS